MFSDGLITDLASFNLISPVRGAVADRVVSTYDKLGYVAGEAGFEYGLLEAPYA